MATWFDGWSTASEDQPRAQDFDFDIDWALSSLVGLRARVPADAFTAETLGVDRIGHGALISEDGIVLTIGYLVTEAEHVTLTAGDGRTVPAHVLGIDQASGFGLVQAMGPLDLPPIALAPAASAPVGERVIVAGVGGRRGAVSGHVIARQAFAGYWEYLLEEAIFTAPAHPFWSGAAVVGPDGELLGLGSLLLHRRRTGGKVEPVNLAAPIGLLPPILDALAAGGRDLPARPWLGLYAQDVGDQVVIAGCADDAPAWRAGLEKGDVVLAVAGGMIIDLADFYRRLWSLGAPGVDVPLTLMREGDVFDVRVTSRDRRRFLKAPSVQ
jgi:S1-C subfamily serine protease